jgi:hypothetical protein
LRSGGAEDGETGAAGVSFSRLGCMAQDSKIRGARRRI